MSVNHQSLIVKHGDEMEYIGEDLLARAVHTNTPVTAGSHPQPFQSTRSQALWVKSDPDSSNAYKALNEGKIKYYDFACNNLHFSINIEIRSS